MQQGTGRSALIDAVLLEAMEQAKTEHAVFPEHQVGRVILTEELAVLGFYDYLMAVPLGLPRTYNYWKYILFDVVQRSRKVSC